MTDDPQESKDLLLPSDDEYSRLVAKHHELESRLVELAAKHYLTEPEQVEEVTLKKRKLQIKDRMADISRRRLSTTAGLQGLPAPSPPAH